MNKKKAASDLCRRIFSPPTAPFPLMPSAALRRVNRRGCRSPCPGGRARNPARPRYAKHPAGAGAASVRPDAGTRSTGAWRTAGGDLGAFDRLRHRDLAGKRGLSSRTPIAFMAGSCGSSPSAWSAFTSSSAPASIMASKRRSMRPTSSARSGSMTTKRALSRSISDAPRSPCHSRIERPEASSTSSARTMRWPSPARSVAAACGSSRIRTRCSFSGPFSASSPRQRSRTGPGISGISEMPSSRARK